MNYSLQMKPKAASTKVSVGHDDDQHVSILFGEDLSALKQVSELEDGQPEGSTESLSAGVPSPTGDFADCQEGNCQRQCYPPAVSRVIDPATGSAKVTIVLGPLERNKWLAQVIGIIDSTSEKDVVDITIVPNNSGVCSTLEHRSLLSSIERCRATVITRASALTNMGDVVLWLSGDQLQYSKSMSVIFMRQPLTGFGGDITDFALKGDDAINAVKEYCEYIIDRNLFTKDEIKSMFETRGMLCSFGKELEARVAGLKPVKDN